MVIAYGNPKLICKILVKYKDGSALTVVSDNSWKATPSPITFSSIYGGEDYDATLEKNSWNNTGYNDTEWKQAITVAAQRAHWKQKWIML